MRRLRFHAAIVLAGGLAFTIVVVAILVAAMNERDRQAFEASASAAQDAVLDRIETSIALLRGTAGLFASRDDDPTVEEFRAYMNRVALRELYPGLLGIGYSRRIAASELESLEQRLQQQGQAGFRVWPRHERAEWHSIVFLEPLDARNQAAIGYDMFTHPVRREAMARARDTGLAAASSVVELVQEIDARKQPGFLIYLPVYRGGTTPASGAERRARLRGFAYAPIRAEDFLSSAFSHERHPTVSFRISLESSSGERTLLYERSAKGLRHGRHALETQADVAGRTLHFEFRSADTLPHPVVVPLLIGLAGTGISFALAGLLWREEHVRNRIQEALEREQAARSQAERANRMKDEFLATLSHELRTPLNAIVGWASLLRSGRMPAADTNGALEVIERNARAQARLIDDLLDTNRIVSGKLEMNLHPLDLAPVLEAAIDTLLPLAEQKGVSVSTRIAARPLTVHGDAGRLQQVAWNLLSNAVKFTPSGGRIDIVLERVGTRARLSIADTGEGIDPEFIGHIFDRFSQANGSRTRRHGGLGLGLAIVRELVALHHGTVEARSEGIGKGATFVVELPLSAGVPDARQAAPQPGAVESLAGLRVLVVDDEPDARYLLKMVLEQRSAVVRCVASAQEALAALDDFAPDVVTSDIGMADVDGYELIRRIRLRAPERHGEVPAIALTAYARDEDRAEALRAGFADCLVKPVQPDRLIATLAGLARSTRGASASARRTGSVRQS